jgi:hypothetical protein
LSKAVVANEAPNGRAQALLAPPSSRDPCAQVGGVERERRDELQQHLFVPERAGCVLNLGERSAHFVGVEATENLAANFEQRSRAANGHPQIVDCKLVAGAEDSPARIFEAGLHRAKLAGETRADP